MTKPTDAQMRPVTLEIANERQRQVSGEGWTFEHDDKYRHGELADAAACYALHAGKVDCQRELIVCAPAEWPWDEEWWKPADRRRDLVKAAALIVAEIERLDRAAAERGQEATRG